MAQETPRLNITKLYQMFKELGWETEDNITIELGGAVTSGISQPDGYNERWSLQKGEQKYNKDAFIVIKNSERSQVTSSLSAEQQIKQIDDKLNYDTSGK